MKEVILITGTYRGIGKALYDILLANGYIVIGCDVNFKDALKSNLGKLHCDITNKESIIRAVSKVINKYKRIDVLINCAGIISYDPIEKIKEDDFEKLWQTNVKGAFLFSQAVLGIMKMQKKGYIINMSSIRGITGAPNKGAYSATKFAVRGLTQTILAENKQYNIKATAICPGLVSTGSNDKTLKHYKLTEKDVLTKEDIAQTVLYLLKLSPKAYIRDIIIGGQL